MNREGREPAVVVRMTGGLGNQLFQYATGLALSQRIGGALYLDTSAYAQDSQREYRLGRLKVPPRVLDPARLDRMLRPGWLSRRVLGRRGLQVIRHHEASFRPDLLEVDGECYLDGYWQSQRYFHGIQDTVRQRLEFEAANIEVASLCARAASGRVASVHIRRGDYASVRALTEWHGVLPVEHYHECLRLLGQRFDIEEVFVFTDDPEWVRLNFSPSVPMTVVSGAGASEFADLAVMKACRYHVIANSSFSWWGAWLSGAEPAAIVAPRRWFATEREDSSAIVPESWTRV